MAKGASWVFLCDYCNRRLEKSHQYAWWEDGNGVGRDVTDLHYECTPLFLEQHKDKEWFVKGTRAWKWATDDGPPLGTVVCLDDEE